MQILNHFENIPMEDPELVDLLQFEFKLLLLTSDNYLPLLELCKSLDHELQVVREEFAVIFVVFLQFNEVVFNLLFS
jgi:hypothetical protein